MGNKNITNKKKKTKKRYHTLLKSMGITLLVLLIPVLVFLFWATNKLDKLNNYEMDASKVTVNENINQDLTGYTNIAIFGVDSRENELLKNTRSDSIIIASINNKTKEVKLVSVYRDTLADIDDVGYRKINSAYATGGPEKAISTLNKHLDLDISDFVTVNFSAVTNVVDAVGGITIEIEKDEITALNKNIKDGNKLQGTNSPLITEAGKQTLDGTQALAYSRIRKTSGNDFRRTQRQRNVIYAILDKAKSSGLSTINTVVDEMLPQIYTSLTPTEIFNLAKNVFSYQIVEDTGFPFEKTGATVNRASVVLATDLAKDVTELHKLLFNTVDYTPSKTVQEISKTLQTYSK